MEGVGKHFVHYTTMNKISSKNFYKRILKMLSLQVVVLVLIFFMCLWGILGIADMIFEDKNLVFDEKIFYLIEPYVNNFNTRLMQYITFFGSSYFLLPANILLAGVFLVIKKQRLHSLVIIAVSITSTAVLFSLKFILQRQRPLLPLLAKAHGYSFPSGHTFTSTVFFGMLAYIVFKTINNKLLKYVIIVLLFVLVLLIGLSRIYLKLHYASDVVAGLSLGVVWLLIAKWVLLKVDRKMGHT